MVRDAQSNQRFTIGEILIDEVLGEQGWHKGESTRLPPMWLGFDSRIRRHMWVEFVVGSCPCFERFFSAETPVFPLLKNQFQFDLR